MMIQQDIYRVVYLLVLSSVVDYNIVDDCCHILIFKKVKNAFCVCFSYSTRSTCPSPPYYVPE